MKPRRITINVRPVRMVRIAFWYVATATFGALGAGWWTLIPAITLVLSGALYVLQHREPKPHL